MLPALLQIQTDITGRLGAELHDWGITVRSQRKMIVENTLLERELVISLTNGLSGAGVLVQMPAFVSERPNVPGPIGNIAMTCTVIECPELNMNASTGTRRSAEEVAARVAQLIDLWNVQGIGSFYCDPASIAPTEADDGCIAYNVKFRMAFGHEVLAKTANPVVTGTHTAVTITASEGTAYYTVDGQSFPGPDLENSFTYSAPFATTVGAVVRAVAYASSKTGSNLIEFTVST